MTTEEKLEKVRLLRPIDDVLFEVLASKPGVCEEILRTIMCDPKLVVNDVIVQSSERNIYGKSVRLDALCVLGNKTKCNIEVQRADTDDHLRRARFNAASITVKDSNAGDHYENVLDVYIVYISQSDILHGEKTIYHIDKVIRENGEVIDDGEHEIFVNTAVNDESDIADLMACFMKPEFNDPKFPVLSSAMKDLKSTEGGISAVCEVMQYYENLAVKNALIDKIRNLMESFGMSAEQVMEGMKIPKEEQLEFLSLL